MTSQRSRREFLQQTGLGAALLAFGGGISLAAEEEKKAQSDNVLCCETYSLHGPLGSGALTLEKIPALYKQLGIPGIAWNDMFFKSWDKAYIETLNQAAKDAGCKPLCLIMEGNLAAADETARRKQIEDNTRKLKAAALLGVPVVRMNLGTTGKDEDDETVGVERCIAAFRELLPLAKELKIKMTIENHGGCSRTADRILKIIKGSDPAWVGSCLDFGNWPAEPKELRYSESAKLIPYAYHLHIKTHGFNPDGQESQIDYARVFDMMRKANYKGAVSIEWEGSTPADQVEGVKLTRDLIRKHWPGL